MAVLVTPIEIFAAFIAIVTVIKILVVLTNPRKWLNITSGIYKNPKATAIVMAMLALVVLYYLLQVTNIVTIFAVIGFVSLMYALAFLNYSNEMLALSKKILNKKITGWILVYTLVWLALALWVLYEIFL